MAHTIREIKRLNPADHNQVLIPDFRENGTGRNLVIEANPDIISHNMETVRRISPLVRSAANYDTSLQVIGHIARSGTKSKSGIMVGLGETPQEVETIMDDLLAVRLPDSYDRTIFAAYTPTLSGCRVCDATTIRHLQNHRFKKKDSAL